jgi:hypothetical protein
VPEDLAPADVEGLVVEVGVVGYEMVHHGRGRRAPGGSNSEGDFR